MDLLEKYKLSDNLYQQVFKCAVKYTMSKSYRNTDDYDQTDRDKVVESVVNDEHFDYMIDTVYLFLKNLKCKLNVDCVPAGVDEKTGEPWVVKNHRLSDLMTYLADNDDENKTLSINKIYLTGINDSIEHPDWKQQYPGRLHADIPIEGIVNYNTGEVLECPLNDTSSKISMYIKYI